MANRKIIPAIAGYTKVETVSFVQMRIMSNTTWASRACVALYEHQTVAEKRNALSSGHNGWGFNRVDSPYLSRLAKRIRRKQAMPEEIEAARSRLRKYARQLICLAHEKDSGKVLKRQLDYYYKNEKNKIPF